MEQVMQPKDERLPVPAFARTTHTSSICPPPLPELVDFVRRQLEDRRVMWLPSLTWARPYLEELLAFDGQCYALCGHMRALDLGIFEPDTFRHLLEDALTRLERSCLIRA